MRRTLEQLIETFVLPLLCGGPVHVGPPLRPRDHDAMVGVAATMLGNGQLRYARLRRAQELTPHPGLPDPDLDELALWIGLHNTLVFDHPDRSRVWARASTWRRAEGATRTMLTLPLPTVPGEGLVRHLSVGAFIELERTDIVLPTAAGEVRYVGQELPRRRLSALGAPLEAGVLKRYNGLRTHMHRRPIAWSKMRCGHHR